MRETLVQRAGSREAAVWRSRPGVWTFQIVPGWLWMGVFLAFAYHTFRGQEQTDVLLLYSPAIALLIFDTVRSLVVPSFVRMDDLGITFGSGRQSDFTPWGIVLYVKHQRMLGFDPTLIVRSQGLTRVPLRGLTGAEQRAVLKEAEIRLYGFRTREKGDRRPTA